MSRKRWLLVSILAVLLLYLPGFARLQELKAKNKILLLQINNLKKENSKLAQQIDRLDKDSFYIEKKAREKMGVSKKGEVIYKVIDNKKDLR
jgi:cell division protein FtsB